MRATWRGQALGAAIVVGSILLTTAAWPVWLRVSSALAAGVAICLVFAWERADPQNVLRGELLVARIAILLFGFLGVTTIFLAVLDPRSWVMAITLLACGLTFLILARAAFVKSRATRWRLHDG